MSKNIIQVAVSHKAAQKEARLLELHGSMTEHVDIVVGVEQIVFKNMRNSGLEQYEIVKIIDMRKKSLFIAEVEFSY